MQHFWMTHFPDYLNEKGAIPKDISKPAFRMAHALSEFISYATDFGSEVDNLPRCFIVRKGKRCIGRVRPLINFDDDSIGWQCLVCMNYGCITGWQGTFWDISDK